MRLLAIFQNLLSFLYCFFRQAAFYLSILDSKAASATPFLGYSEKPCKRADRAAGPVFTVFDLLSSFKILKRMQSPNTTSIKRVE
jgi:hypothetical protein